MLTSKYGITSEMAKEMTKDMQRALSEQKWDKASKSFIRRTQQELDLIERNRLEFARRLRRHNKIFKDILGKDGVDGVIKHYENLLAGSREAGEFKGSVAVLKRSIKARTNGFFNGKLKEADIRENVAIERMIDPEEFKDILKAMDSLNKGQHPKGIDPTNIGIARAINETAIYTRDNAIAGGVELNIRADHLITQKLTHNIGKMLDGGANRAEAKKIWVEKTFNRLDFKKTFPNIHKDSDRLKALGEVFEDITTAKLKRGTGTVTKARKLHFKSAEDFADQHLDFGEGTLHDMFSAQTNGLAKAEALNTVIGPRAEQMLDNLEGTIEGMLLKEVGNKARNKFMDTNPVIGAKGRRDALRGITIGYKDTPIHTVYGEVLDGLRSLSLLKLGGAVLNTPTDLATSVASLMSTTGMNMWDAQRRLMGEWTKQLSPVHRKQMAQLMGIDAQLTLNRLTGEESKATGMLGKLTNSMMKLTFLDQTTKINQGTLATVKGNFLAEQASKSLDQLDPRLQAQFKSFDISAKEWDILRNAVDDHDGFKLITPQKVAELGNRKLENKYGAMILHDSGFGAITPDARSKAALSFGINPESVHGKFLSTLFMFKSFSIRAAGAIEEIVKNNPNANNATFFKALKGQGNLQIFGALMGLGFTTAATGLWARDLVFGRTPRDMTRPENIAEALSRSVMPLWGEYIIDAFSGDFERKSIYDNIAGPGFSPITNTIGIISTLSNDLLSETRTGVATKKRALKILQEVIPGTYVPLVRPILDMTLYKALGNYADPNWDRKEQQKLERRGQSAWYQ